MYSGMRRMTNLWRMRSTLGAVGMALLFLPAAMAAQGAIGGVVRDEAGVPLAGVRISVEHDSVMAVLTGRNGSFLVERVPAGRTHIRASKIGYRPVEAMVSVPRDSAVIVNITLVQAPQQLQDVVVTGELRNQVRGVVLDSAGAPVPGVIVEVTGLRRRMTTSEDGEFVFTDLDPGTYLMQWRKPGYTVAHRSVRMVNGIERDLSVRLRPIGDSRYTAELAAIVAQEAGRRQGFAGNGAAIVGRDELDRFGKSRLIDVLANSSGGDAYRRVPTTCLLVNGYEAAVTGIGGFAARPGPAAAGPQSVKASLDAALNPGAGGARNAGAPAMSWLSHFRADEVEMVEIYPLGTENSRTLCGRFSQSSGCGCPPDPSGIVIWLR